MPDDLRIKIDAQVDVASSAKTIEGQLSELSKKINGRIQLGAEINENDVVAQVKSVAAKAKTISGRVSIPVGIDVQTDTLRRKLEIQADTLKKSISKIDVPLDWGKFNQEFSRGTLESLRQAQKELSILREQYRNFDAGIAKILPRDAIENLNKYIGDTVSKTSELKTKFEGLRTGVPEEAFSQFQKLYTLQKDIAAIPTSDIDARSKKYNEISAILDNLNRQYKLFSNSQKQVDQGIAFDTIEKRAQKLMLTVENLKKKYDAFSNNRNLMAQYNQLLDSAKAAQSAKEIANVNAQIGRFEQVIESAGKRQRSFTAEMSNNIKKMGNWMLLGGMMAGLIRDFKQLFTNVIAIDSAMTEVKKVTQETGKAYNDFLTRAASNAVKLGASMTDLINSTADFARLGFNIKDAENLAQIATIYYKVGDGLSSIDQASSSVISTMKAFGISAQNSMSIVDMFNEVGNKFAVTSGGVGDAMQRAGAALATSNNSLEQSIALWTAMDEIMQDGDVSATSLRFITQRMRNTAGQLKEMGEDADGAAESVTKLQQEIRKLTGVDIMADADTFRSTYDVLKDISDVWSELSDKSQADVIRLMAGNRQSAAFSALMTNFSTAEKVLETASSSAGSAMKEHAKWMDSVAAKQEQVTAQFQAFSSAILNSDLIKGTYDAGSGILGFLTQATEMLHAFPTLATLAAGALSIKLPNIWEKTTGGVGLSDAAKNLFKKQKPYTMLSDEEASATFEQFAIATDKGAVALREFNLQTKDKGIKAYLSTVKNGAADLSDYQKYIGSANQALAQMTLKAKLASVGMKALSVATSMAISFGISLAIDFVVTQISNLINAQDNAIEKAKEVASAWKESADSLKSMKDALNGAEKDFDRLSKGVNSFGDNVSLTSDEYARYTEIANTIADLFPQMVSGWDSENNAILKTTTSMQSLNAEYEKAAALNRDKILSTAGDVFSGFKAESSKKYPFMSAAQDLQNVLRDTTLTDSQKQAQINGLKNRWGGFSITPILDSLGLNNASVEELKNNGDKIQAYLNTLSSELGEASKDVKTAIIAGLDSDQTYKALDSSLKQVVGSVINGLDYALLDNFDTMNDLNAYVKTNIISAMADPEISSAVTKALSVNEAMKKNEASVHDFVLWYENMVRVLFSKSKSADFISGVTSLFDPDSIRTMTNRVMGLVKDEYDGMVSSLSLEDLTVAYKLENVGDLSFEGLKTAIANAKKSAAKEIVVPFDDIVKSYNNQLDRIDYEKSLAQSTIDLKQKNGVSITAEDYTNAITPATKKVFALIDERSKLTDSLKKSIADGSVKEGTDEWNKQTEAIEKTNIAINDENQYIGELSKKIAEIPFEDLSRQEKSLEGVRSQLESSLSFKQASGSKIFESDYQALSKNAEQLIAIKNGMKNYYLEQMKGIPSTYPIYDEYRSKIAAISVEIDNLRTSQLEWTKSAEGLGISSIESEIDRVKNGQQSVKNDISLLEAQGKTASSGQYEYLIQTSNELISLYEEMNRLYSKQIEIADKTSDKYEENTKKIEENKQAISDAKVQQEEWKKEVTKTLTAYDKWLKAKDSKESGDTYRGISDAIEEVNELIKDGETGTLKYKAGLELLVPDSAKTSLKTVKDYLASIKGYFTEGPQGARKFAADLAKNAPELAKYNVKTGDLSLYTRDISKIAAAMNMTEEAAYSMIGRLNELVTNGPGFTVDAPEVKEADLKFNDLGTKQVNDLNAKPLEDKTAKISFELDDESKTTVENVADKVKSAASKSLGGNVSLNPNARPQVVIDEKVLKELQKKGWDVGNSDIGTTMTHFSSTYSDGKGLAITVTPILPDGTVLSKGDFETYVDELLYGGKDNILKNDTKGIVLGIFDSGSEEQSISDSEALSDAVHNLGAALQEVNNYSKLSINIDNQVALQQIDELNAKKLEDKTATITYVVKETPGFATGTSGAPGGPALVGEGEGAFKGPELIHNKKKNRWWLATKKMLTNLDKGDVVYNAKETKQMMNGNIGALKGKAYAFGTNNQQTDSGTGGASGGSGDIDPPTKPKKRSDPFAAFMKSLEKLYDWFERAIEVADRLVNRLKKSADLEVGYKNKNKVLDKASKATKEEIKTAQRQEKEYTKKAEQVAAQSGLSPDMIKKIQDGSLDMESLDAATKKKVEAYKEWYDKAQAVKDKLIELKQQEKELAQQKIDNIIEAFENRLGRIDSASQAGQSKIDLKKAQGKQITAADYAPLKKAEQSRMATLAKEREAVAAELQKQIDAGTIKVGSDEWYKYQQQLAAIDEEATQAAISIEEINAAIAAIAVNNLQTALGVLQQIETATQGAISLAEAQGGSGTADQYNALIGNSNQQIANMEEQNDLLRQQQVGLDPLSDRYKEIQDQIDQNTNAINDAKIAQEGWNDAIVDIEIDAIQDQIDSLNEVNDQLQRQYELQDKLEAVEKARQRTRLVYKEGVGFVRMADEKAIRDAERDLAQTQHQETIAQLQHQIDLLEDIKTNTNLYNPDGTPVAPASTTTNRGLIPLSVGGITQVNSRGMSSVASLVNGTNFANQMASIITAGLSGITSNSAFMNTDKPQINVKVEINNPNFNEVSGVGEFARTITATLAPALQQEISKYK